MTFGKKPLITIFLLITSFVSCGGGGNKRLPPVSGMDAELTRCMQLSSHKKYQDAVACLDVFKSRYPNTPQSASADLVIGDNYFNKKEYLLAAETYQSFLKNNPYHDKQDYAYFKSGMAYLKDSPKAIDRDQQYLETAAQNFSMVGRYFPNSQYLHESEDFYKKTVGRLAAREYYVGRFYYKYGELLSSIPRFTNVVKNFAGVGYDERSFYYLVMVGIRTNQPELARQAYLAFEQRFPNSGLVKSAKGKLVGAFKN